MARPHVHCPDHFLSHRTRQPWLLAISVSSYRRTFYHLWFGYCKPARGRGRIASSPLHRGLQMINKMFVKCIVQYCGNFRSVRLDSISVGIDRWIYLLPLSFWPHFWLSAMPLRAEIIHICRTCVVETDISAILQRWTFMFTWLLSVDGKFCANDMPIVCRNHNQPASWRHLV